MDRAADPPVWRRIEGSISATAKDLRQTYDAVLAHIGLTLPESTLLAYVADNGPLNQTQIAAGLESGRAMIGQRIDALESLGYLERQPHSTDRRVWLVTATDLGRLLTKQILEVDEWWRTSIRAGTTAEERRMFVRVLLRIQENLKKVSESEVPGVNIAAEG